MPKLYRRSWEKQATGRTGSISNPLPKRTGTDGVISGAARTPAPMGTPVKVFVSASASFVASDVGRLIRIEGTTGKRYDWTYIIDSVNAPNSVNLRLNHNLPGISTSWARFYENGTGIKWTILPSATFTADAVGDLQEWFAGSYLTIDTSINEPQNKGMWKITHRLDSQTCIVSRSWFTYPLDYTDYDTWFYRDDYYDFVAETGMRWSIGDREALNPSDFWMQLVQAYMDMGWTLVQQRALSASHVTPFVLQDVVLFSPGEPDATVIGGKQMYMRWTLNANGSTRYGPGYFGSSLLVNGGLFPHWDVSLTATVPANDPGNGSMGLALYTYVYGSSPDSAFSGNARLFNFSSSGVDFGTPVTAGGYAELYKMDWWVFGDLDEVFSAFNQSGLNGNTYGYVVHSWLRVPTPTNKNVMQVIAPTVTATGFTTIDVGTTNPRSLGYAEGDNLTIIGYRAGATKEYVETSTITGIDTSDPLHNKIVVTALVQNYGNGPGVIKAHCGEDPWPVIGFAVTGTAAPNIRIHNVSRLGNATGRDYDATNNSTNGAFSWTVPNSEIVNPNKKTGRFGIGTVRIEYGANEFRGLLRHFWSAPSWAVSEGTKFVCKNGDVYCEVLPYNGSVCWVVGPMSKAMAGVP